ncbi:MAG: A/G-specific adenine glycosylase [Halorhodospira halophila]|uniref:A/G-specific adenine glycosylase n=1 Tax=Halorhodospira TaxID=85108 RepID=UPI0019149746|nr:MULTISPECIES: A/G-specific adenine glycosylase [Halorhodospira]MBK5935307.1 A/G-specific adenine glycosylase [Halorhodospira halophila]MBK5943519.1 A/G-specific adenine glycosylase [Halorhodospira halophila]MCC3750177.1 A/G-specific adenine glycosylase [Halorhodospira halophila]MCG5527049.1 A/G-specific adenine glycosylase [Halorhodospira halophila]MCG5532322.1 A/G-specific adenine glycosylase [Halorhodospira sp. 9621]
MRRWATPDRCQALQEQLIAWQRQHGRNDLPWQQPATPYRVWISEVMLQQTRVETVVPYFERFMGHYPDVIDLAHAELDDVLGLWAGLGYYARARNLHAAAQRIEADWNGHLPDELAALQTLPGIGPSTAGAIRSLGHGLPAPILDGNVKRVLARLAGIEGWPGRNPVARELWALSAALIPEDDCRRFNQGLMDLGALVCTPQEPACLLCPLASACTARAAGHPEAYPAPRPARRRPRRQRQLLLIEHTDTLLLERRPATGIWGGLWSLPECQPDEDPLARAQALGAHCEPAGRLPERHHALTHFELILQPVRLRWHTAATAVGEPTAQRRWFRPGQETLPGLPAPIRRILRDAGYPVT